MLQLQRAQTLFMDGLLPKRTRKEQRSQVFNETIKRIFWEVMEENDWKLEDFAVEEMKDEQSVSRTFSNTRIKP